MTEVIIGIDPHKGSHTAVALDTEGACAGSVADQGEHCAGRTAAALGCEQA